MESIVMESTLKNLLCRYNVDEIKIRNLLKRDSSEVNKISKGYYTYPLTQYLAKEWCSVEIVRLLLDFGAEINCTDRSLETSLYKRQDQSPLCVALSWRRNYDIIKLLLDNGADASAWHGAEHTSICCALRSGASKEIVKLLMDAGCHPSDCRQHVSPFQCASFKPRGVLCEGVRELLVDAGGHLLSFGNDGNSPLCFALRAGAGPKDIQWLLNKGIALDACMQHNSVWLCYMYGCLDTRHRILGSPVRADVVELLLNAGASSPVQRFRPNEIGRFEHHSIEVDTTPLHYALEFCEYEVQAIQMFLNLPDVDVNLLNSWHNTLLHSTVKNRWCKPSMVQLLIDRGASVNVENREKMIPLHLAIGSACRWYSIVQHDILYLLLNNGSLVNAYAWNGDTPLYMALTDNGEVIPNIVRLLLYAGAGTLDGELLKLALNEHLGSLTIGATITLCCLKLILKYRFLEDPVFEIAHLIEQQQRSLLTELITMANECANEVQLMKDINVDADHTILDLLKGRSMPKMVLANKNPAVSEDCINQLLQTLSVHPCSHFFYDIAAAVGKSAMEIKLQKLQVYTMKHNPGSPIQEKVYLGYDCTCKLAKYLVQPEDLLGLIVAFNFSNNQIHSPSSI